MTPPLLHVATVVLILGTLLRAPVAQAGDDRCTPNFYGTYSIGTKGQSSDGGLASRLWELRELGGNMIIATGNRIDILALLPDGMQAVPGCGLMEQEDWQTAGQWDEAKARGKLARLAERFARHPRVYGVCLTHEITEYADHERRVWMYKLAKEYFPDKKVMHYYGRIYEQVPGRGKVYSYGKNGEVETDIFFVSLPAASRDGRFDIGKARRLHTILENAARTPRIPIWGQTSINADHKYVKGPAAMIAVWGQRGERMKTWTDHVFETVHVDAKSGRTLRLSGFFWRSLGRFPYDLGYPPFTGHRNQMREIGLAFRGGRSTACATAPTPGDS